MFSSSTVDRNETIISLDGITIKKHRTSYLALVQFNSRIALKARPIGDSNSMVQTAKEKACSDYSPLQPKSDHLSDR